MKGYHSMMVDIAEQLILKWKRLNPQEPVQVADDMTRLTLDTIGLVDSIIALTVLQKRSRSLYSEYG